MTIFLDTLKNEFNNSVKSFYIGRIYNSNIKKPPNNINDLDIISEDDLYLFNFLSNLPQNEYINVSKKIWEFILELDIEDNWNEKLNNYIKKTKGNGDQNKIIKSDLKKAEKFKELINKTFQTHSKGSYIMGHSENFNNKKRINKLVYSETFSVYEKKTYNIDELFEIVDLIINDLKTKEFKFIGKNIYYENIKSTKTDFKNYLLNLCKEYNIPNRNTEIECIMQNI